MSALGLKHVIIFVGCLCAAFVRFFASIPLLESLQIISVISYCLLTSYFGGNLLHIKNTHFDSVASVVITRFASVTFFSQVSQVLNKTYYHDAHVVPVNKIKRTLGTPQTFDLEEEERLTGLMNLFPSENTQKTKF